MFNTGHNPLAREQAQKKMQRAVAAYNDTDMKMNEIVREFRIDHDVFREELRIAYAEGRITREPPPRREFRTRRPRCQGPEVESPPSETARSAR